MGEYRAIRCGRRIRNHRSFPVRHQ
jgi:hypothetical protein